MTLAKCTSTTDQMKLLLISIGRNIQCP